MKDFYDPKYANIENGTKIFFKGDEKDASCSGTICGEISDAYVINMDNGKVYFVNPIVFEEFGGLFQIEEEREAKLSWLPKN